MKSKILIFLFLLSAKLYAHREDSYYLHGTFGKQKVALQIDEFGQSCIAYFFYEKDKHDHFFEGTKSPDSIFYLTNYVWDEERTERTAYEQIALKETKLNVWEGIYTDEEGEKFEILLNPIVIDTINHPLKEVIHNKDITPFRAFRTKDIHLKRKKKEKVTESLAIIHYIEKDSGIKWFRIKDKTNRISLDAINTYLDYQLFLMINEKYNCSLSNQQRNYTVDYKINLLNSELISFSSFTHAGYNGNSNQDVETIQTLNIVDASQVMLEDLIWLSSKPYQDLSKGEYKWYQYRYKEFGNSLFKIIQSSTTGDDQSQLKKCNLLSAKKWQLPNWYLTPKGIMFKPKTDQSDCKMEFFVDYDKFKSYIVNKYNFLKDYKH